MDGTGTKRVVVPLTAPRPRYESTIKLDPSTLKQHDPGFPVSPAGTHGALYFGERWYHECGRKRMHLTKEAADVYGAKLKKRVGKIINSYLCRWCEWWHVGNRLEK